MSWSAVSSTNYHRSGLAVACAPAPSSGPGSGPGRRLYAVGGLISNGVASVPIQQIEAYDPKTDTWTVIATELPTPRSDVAAVGVDGKLFVIGGDNGGQALATLEVFDPASGTWQTNAPDMATARTQLGAAVGPDGRVYAIGGVDGSGNSLASLEIYDPATNTWTPGQSMSVPRASLAVCALGAFIYAMGGISEPDGGGYALVEVYDPASDSWGTLPPLPAALYDLAAAPGPGGLIYAIGGTDASHGSTVSTVYALDPSSPMSGWTIQPALAAPTQNLAAAVGPDGLLYAVGGQGFDLTPLSSAGVFDAGKVQPDPYIGNGTYQSPDIILIDHFGNEVPLGGAPGGAWDTLLLPNTNYSIQARISNAAAVPAPATVVRFWHFPGGVGSAGVLIDTQYVTVPAGPMTVTVASVSPFVSAPLGQHECVAVSLANPLSPHFNVDTATGADVVDPTAANPAGSSRYGSAWRNTDSVTMMAGGHLRLPFLLTGLVGDHGHVPVEVTASKVPHGWGNVGEAAELAAAMGFLGARPRAPLFLLPGLRAALPPAADLRITIETGEGIRVPSAGSGQHHLPVTCGADAEFVVTGQIPDTARAGDAYLVEVHAHYPADSGRHERTIRFLEVVYVK